jgi:hypothetical protein
VEQLLDTLAPTTPAQVDVRTLVEEDVSFAPPPSLRRLAVVR